jgi:lysyl-tRNA synthetase class 2
MSTPNYSTETIDRIKKLDRIRSLGVNPFATKFDMTNTIGDILARYPAKIEEGTVSSFRPIEEVIPSPTSDVAIAGRVMLHRSFGKICFASLSDGTGRMQVLFSRENCSIVVDGEAKSELSGEAEPVTAYKFAEKLIDLGDFVGVRGELFYTHK